MQKDQDLGAATLEIDYKKANILCPSCSKITPFLKILEEESELYIEILCKYCNFKEKQLLNDFIKRSLLDTEHFCQKKGGVHSDKKATGKINGKYLCDECIRRLIEDFDFEIEKIDDIKSICESHKEKLSYFCETCSKNLCGKCTINEHKQLNHDLTNLDELNKNIQIENFDKSINNVKNYIRNDLPKIKDNIKTSLEKMIAELEKMYSDFSLKVESLIKYSEIIKQNYIKTSEYPEYSIINNTINTYALFQDNFFKKLEDFDLNNTNGIINAYENYKQFLCDTIIKNNSSHILEESTIATKIEDKINLKKWLSKRGVIKDIKLIYKATRDGENWRNFHEKCDEKGPTLSLFETVDGKRFGGFTMKSWQTANPISRVKDEKAFLFSLDKSKSYKIVHSEYAISNFVNNCQIFGNQGEGDGLYLDGNSLSGKGCSENHLTKNYDIDDNYELSGDGKSQLKENECFQVIFFD